MTNILFETYKKSGMKHGHHIYAMASVMAINTMCSYPSLQHEFTHCKCVLRCCANFPRIDLPGQKLYRHNSNTYPSTRFHIYYLIARCAVHGRCPMDENKCFRLCLKNIGFCDT